MRTKLAPEKTLREILDEASAKAGLNWCDVASSAGITRGGIAKIRSGQRVPSSSTLLKMLRSLGASASVLDQWKIDEPA